jgi:phytoene dehydrogenase-like protein
MPEMAPPGKHVIIAAGMPRPCIEPISPRREFELNMLDIRENLPGFDEHGEVLMAMTFHRDWPMFGTWPGRGLPQKTPVVNLYLVGDRALPPGWVASSGVARTAQIVSEDITLRYKPGEAVIGR